MLNSINTAPIPKRHIASALVAALLALAALMAMAPGTASAATHAGIVDSLTLPALASTSGSKSPQIVSSQPTIQNTSASTAETACPITRGGHVGHYICGTDWFTHRFADGREHTFIIGLDHAVWNIVEYANGGSSGWRSLGGWAQIGVYRHYVYSPSNLGIWVIGGDGNPWCKALNGSWGSWHRC
jgi:hypothetical protein